MGKKSKCCSQKSANQKHDDEQKSSDKNDKVEYSIDVDSTDKDNEEKIKDRINGMESVKGEIEKAVESAALSYKLAFWRKISVALSFLLLVSLSFQFSEMLFVAEKIGNVEIVPHAYASEVLPESGVKLPIIWGDLGKRMVEAGVIDAEKFEMLYESRGGMSDETKSLLYGEDNGYITLTSENSGELLNVLWAFGLSNKSSILETGLMTSYDGKEATSREEAMEKAGNMAATGGWPLSVGAPMDHYSAYEFVTLTSDEWELVEKVASGIYRPCCNNPSHFPDCNHGMAMLGLLELLVDEGLTENEMFDIALSVNSFWFPDTYLTIAEYMDINGISWNEVDSKKVLGPQYSSGSGFASVRSVIEEPAQTGSSGGCGA